MIAGKDGCDIFHCGWAGRLGVHLIHDCCCLHGNVMIRIRSFWDNLGGHETVLESLHGIQQCAESKQGTIISVSAKF